MLDERGHSTYFGLDDLQIPNLYPARREVGDLELNANRSLRFPFTPYPSHASAKAASHATTMLIIAFDTWQSQLGSHKKLLAATELLDLPDNGRLLWCVMHGTDICSESRCVSIIR